MNRYPPPKKRIYLGSISKQQIGQLLVRACCTVVDDNINDATFKEQQSPKDSVPLVHRTNSLACIHFKSLDPQYFMFSSWFFVLTPCAI